MFLLTEAGRARRAANVGFESLHGRRGIQFTLCTVYIAKINGKTRNDMSFATLWFSLAGRYCI